MDIIILKSAYKHKVSKKSILSCLMNFRNDIVIDGVVTKRLFAGFDHNGVALEVIAIEDDEHDRLVVIHAMKLRKKFYYLLIKEEDL